MPELLITGPVLHYLAARFFRHARLRERGSIALEWVIAIGVVAAVALYVVTNLGDKVKQEADETNFDSPPATAPPAP